jgi:hypothetical protein
MLQSKSGLKLSKKQGKWLKCFEQAQKTMAVPIIEEDFDIIVALKGLVAYPSV